MALSNRGWALSLRPLAGMRHLHRRYRSPFPCAAPRRTTRAHPPAATRKQGPPAAELQLDWVHGYRSRDARNNVALLASGEVAWPAAAVTVLLRPDAHAQRHFIGHQDDVMCLAMHPQGVILASGGVQGKRKGDTPVIMVWASDSLARLAELKGGHERWVETMCFSPDGARLVSVSAGDTHAMCVWDWAAAKLLARVETGRDRVLSVAWNPYSHGALATVGVRHVAFWSLAAGARGALAFDKPHKGIFGAKAEVQTMVSLAFTAKHCWTGGRSGDIFVWAGGVSHVVA